MCTYQCCLTTILAFVLWSFLCAGYAYLVNSRRPVDDPKKRNYPLIAVFLAPITLPLLLFLSVSLFFLRALVYGLFLILFVVALLIVRQPFLIAAIEKEAKFIGTILLNINTTLIRLFLGPWINDPRAI